MTPAERLDDHKRKPRHLGKLLNASAVGDVGSIVVGDALRFYLKIQRDDAGTERIESARFQVFNANDHLAAASVLCELLPGKSLAEAKALGIADLCTYLDDLDPTLLPAQPWALTGLASAIAAWERGELPSDHDLDPLLCRCHGISEATVRESIRVMDLHETDQVVAATGAGSGCGTCRSDIPRLIAAAHERAPAAPTAPTPGPGKVNGRIPLLRRITEVVTTRIAVDVQQTGGTIELWDFDGKLVSVRLGGTLAADESARRACLANLESVLKQEIDPGLGVAEAKPA